MDSRLRSQRIEMDVQNNNRNLLPGMVTEIIVPLQSDENALTLPSSAVLSATTGTFVIRVNNKKAEWVPIKQGITANGMTEVIAQISIQDKIVKQASEEIRDGSPVNTQSYGNY